MEENPAVSIVVLNWNGKQLTLDCVDSLLALNYENVSIIVVDNHSSDDSVDAVRQRYGDGVTLIENDANLGFAGGNNVGVRHALDRGADAVLLLNNDTIVSAGLLDALVAGLGDDDAIGIVGPKIYYAEPPDQIWFAGGEVFLSRGTARHIGIREHDSGQYQQAHDVDYVTGCALLARREVFEKVGFLDEGYLAYYEDTDFCMRARRAGYRVRYIPEGVLWHRISASTGGQMGRAKVSRKLKSSIRFFGRYASPHHWLTIPLFFTIDVVRIIMLVLTGRIRNTGDIDQAARGSGTSS